MAIFGQDYFRTRGSLMGFGASGTIPVKVMYPRAYDGRLEEFTVPYEIQDIEWPVLKTLSDGSKLMVFAQKRGALPKSVNYRSDENVPARDLEFTGADNWNLDFMPPPMGSGDGKFVVEQRTAAPAPAAVAPARAALMPSIPDRALVSEPSPAPAVTPSQPMPSGASPANLQRQAGSRVTVSPQFVESLVQKWPSYFQFPAQSQGAFSTDPVDPGTLQSARAGAGARAIVPIEKRQAEVPAQKVAAYCVQQAPEGGASTGNMVPVDANCNCPQGYTRVGECPKQQESSGGSKWWILLLVGAGAWAYSRRK